VGGFYRVRFFISVCANCRFCLKTFHGHDNWVRCIDFSVDGRYFVTGSDDQVI
jgi:WD40 repeat protein